MSALKPCPHCGGETTDIEGKGMIWRGQGYGPPQYFELVHHGNAVPDDPFVTCHTRIRGRDEESLAAIWNTRTARSAELEAEYLAALVENAKLRGALETIAAPMAITVRKSRHKMYADLRADATGRIDIARAALAPKETDE